MEYRMKSLMLVFTIVCLLFHHEVKAQHCFANVNYGIVIDPKNIRMLDHGMTYVQINNNQQLFIKGREVKLSPEQLDLINKYSLGIRQQIPEIVSIAIEGVDIGLKAVNKVIGGLTGENSATHQKIQEKFEEIKWRIRARFNHSDQNYYLAPQDLDNFGELFTGEFEQEIEEIISESIDTILMAVGEAILKSNETENTNSSEARLTTFDQRIENISQDLKVEIGSSITTLESKAEEFCLNLVALNKIESQMQEIIPELKNFNLIETQSKN
jgi:hypothetical protein